MAIREGRDDSFMSPQELLDLAPKQTQKPYTDWLAMTKMTKAQLEKQWVKPVLPRAPLSTDSPVTTQTLALVSRESFGCVTNG